MNIISVWLHTIKPWLPFLNSRNIFLVILLIVYKYFTIKYHSTNLTGHTDALFRHECAPEESVVSTVSMEPSITSLPTTTVRSLLVTLQKVQEAMPKVIRCHLIQNPVVFSDKQFQHFFHRRSLTTTFFLGNV